MVLPFWAMVGSFIGLCVCMALNPMLYHGGILKNWSPGLGAMRTIQSNTLDFYFSFVSLWTYIGFEAFEALVQRHALEVVYKPIDLHGPESPADV